MNTITVYMVRRVAWHLDFGGLLIHSHSEQGYHCDGSGPRYAPVAIFTTEREANAEAHRLGQLLMMRGNPFQFTDEWEEMTDLSLDEAAARLVRKGLPPPPPRHWEDTGEWLWRTCETWREWWDRESVNWTTEQLADAWAVFDKFRFYDVIEIELED